MAAKPPSRIGSRLPAGGVMPGSGVTSIENNCAAAIGSGPACRRTRSCSFTERESAPRSPDAGVVAFSVVAAGRFALASDAGAEHRPQLAQETMKHARRTRRREVGM